jgi:hypothetical protein
MGFPGWGFQDDGSRVVGGLPINEPAAQFLAHLEEGHSLGGHVNALSAARVAALAGAAVTVTLIHT